MWRSNGPPDYGIGEGGGEGEDREQTNTEHQIDEQSSTVRVCRARKVKVVTAVLFSKTNYGWCKLGMKIDQANVDNQHKGKHRNTWCMNN